MHGCRALVRRWFAGCREELRSEDERDGAEGNENYTDDGNYAYAPATAKVELAVKHHVDVECLLFTPSPPPLSIHPPKPCQLLVHLSTYKINGILYPRLRARCPQPCGVE
jgi:hypothetical protein